MRGEVGPSRRPLEADERARLHDAAIDVFSAEPRVVAAYLHGSAARGEPAADLDVAIACVGGDPSIAELDAFAARLGRRAGIPGLEIDLRSLGHASPRFGANVLRDGELLFERDARMRSHLESRMMLAWADFQPTWQRMRGRMLGRWRDG
jgi:predicted nucleotidyltransferase